MLLYAPLGAVMVALIRFLLVACCCGSTAAMDNGAARTPPLGFSTWNDFHMDFNASLVRQTAKAMKQRGLLDAGYKLLTIAASTYEHAAVPPWNATPWPKGVTVRNSTGFIQIDPARWPGPGSNLTMCEDATALNSCLAVGTNETRTPEQCGCVNGNEGMRLLIAEVKQSGFTWGSYSNEAGCMVEACAVPELEQSQREGFVAQDRALYIDEWGSEYLMIDSVGITSPDCPGPQCGRNRGNRTYGQQLMERWAHALMAPNPANEPVILHSCHNLCQNDFTGPTLSLATCDPQDGRQQWEFNDMNNPGRFALRQVGGSGLCAGCGDNPEVSCADTAPGGAGANYGAPTWPSNLTIGLGLGMQACIGGARQAWNYSADDGMFVLPKDRSCLGVPSISSGHHSTTHPVVRQRAADGNCNASHPRPHQQWKLKPAERGQLVASSADTSLCLAEGPHTEQVLSGSASDGSRREMPAAETWAWCLNNSNMFRTNTDVNPSWGSIMEQLESRVGLGNISRPGAWAFLDALEVGVPGPLTWVETQAHVALWAVTSSPLFLANDVREGYMQQRLVDLMVNRAMLDVNQQYVGFAGDRLWSNATGKELWAKPLPAGAVGAVMLNRNGSTAGCRNPSKRALDTPCDDDPVLLHEGAQTMELEFASLPRQWLGLDTKATDSKLASAIICSISDIFPSTASNASGPANDKPLGTFVDKFTAVVPPHGVSFVHVSSCRYKETRDDANSTVHTYFSIR